jgi:hypothetical protein
VTGDSIARALGNALVAPIVTLEPGNPERVRTPGTVLLSAETYKAVLADMATSLKTQGFRNIVMCGDSGGNLRPMQEVADALTAKWKGDPTGARVFHIAEYYNYADVEKFEQDVLGVHEQMDLHDDYYIVDHHGPRCRQRPPARAHQGGQGDDQRHQPARREGDREWQEDRRVQNRRDGEGDQEGDRRSVVMDIQYRAPESVARPSS